MMEAVAYDRVSTQRQATNGVMLEARSETIPAYCKFKKWPVIEFHTDPGISGREGKRRPGFERAMKAACQPGRVLVVDSLQRFVRSTTDADQALKRLQAAGGELVICNLGIDTTTTGGKLVYRIIAALAEFESDTISDRIKAFHAYTKDKCGFNPISQQPYGWRVERAGKSWRRVPVESEQALIALARQLRKPQKPMGPPTPIEHVAQQLNDLGHRTRSGGLWRREPVARLLGERKAGKAARVGEKADSASAHNNAPTGGAHAGQAAKVETV